jgi:N-acetylneuraminic acid mutarotase
MPTPMQIQVFDPETQEWTDFITLDDDHAVSDHGTVLYRGKIYVFGGWDEFYQGPRATTFSIDPMDNGKIEDLTPMFTPRGDVAAVHFNHGGANEAYIIGGFGKVICKPLSSVERYDFDEDSWTETSTEKLALVQGRGDKIATVLDKKIYVIGGEDTHEDACDSPDALKPSEKSQAIDNVEVLDPLAKSPSWELHSLIPNSEERFRAAYALDLRANNFYIFGGQKEYNIDCDCYKTANDIYVFHGKHPGKGLGTTATALIVTASIVFVVAVVAIVYKKN